MAVSKKTRADAVLICAIVASGADYITLTTETVVGYRLGADLDAVELATDAAWFVRQHSAAMCTWHETFAEAALLLEEGWTL